MNLTELHKRILTALFLLPIVIYLILFTNITTNNKIKKYLLKIMKKIIIGNNIIVVINLFCNSVRFINFQIFFWYFLIYL